MVKADFFVVELWWRLLECPFTVSVCFAACMKDANPFLFFLFVGRGKSARWKACSFLIWNPWAESGLLSSEDYKLFGRGKKIIRLKMKNRLAENGKSFDWKRFFIRRRHENAHPKIKAEGRFTAFFTGFFCAWQNYLPLSGRQGHHNILYLKSPIRLTPNGAPCGRTHCRTHPNDRHDHIFSFFLNQAKAARIAQNLRRLALPPYTRFSRVRIWHSDNMTKWMIG